MEDSTFGYGREFQSMSYMFLVDEFHPPSRAFNTIELSHDKQVTTGCIYTQRNDMVRRTDFMVFFKDYFTDKHGISICPHLSRTLFSMYKTKQQLWTKQGHFIMGIVWSNEPAELDRLLSNKIGEIISWPYPRLQKAHFQRTKKLVTLSNSQSTFLKRRLKSKEITPISLDYVMDANIPFTTLQSVFRESAKTCHRKTAQKGQNSSQ